MHYPLQGLDPCYSDFRGSSVKHVNRKLHLLEHRNFCVLIKKNSFFLLNDGYRYPSFEYLEQIPMAVKRVCMFMVFFPICTSRVQITVKRNWTHLSIKLQSV